jgi:hypothetical protein
MTKKLKRLLPDAVVVIAAHEGGYWESLCNTYEIALPGIIFEDELFYFGKQNKKALNPSLWIKEKKVTRIDADISDFDNLTKKFSKTFLQSIHKGELEALAILLSQNHQGFYFSTADAAPIRALGALHIGSRGISIEELLEGIGKNTKNPPLLLQYTKKWFQQKTAEGLRDSHLYLRN